MLWGACLSSENQDIATSSCTSETNDFTVSPLMAIRTSEDNTASMSPLTTKIQSNNLDLAVYKSYVGDPKKKRLSYCKITGMFHHPLFFLKQISVALNDVLVDLD